MATSATEKNDNVTEETTILDGLKSAARESGGTYVIECGEVHKLHLLIKEGGHHGINNSPHKGGFRNQVTLSNGETLFFDYFSNDPVDFPENPTN